MDNLNLLGQLTAPTTVGSSVLLGHWSLLNLLIELLLALWVGTLIVRSLQSKHPLLDNMALSVSDKISRVFAAMWAKLPWHVRRWCGLRRLECSMVCRFLLIRFYLFAYRQDVPPDFRWRFLFRYKPVNQVKSFDYFHKYGKWPNIRS